jgi:hypothetical protein
MGEVVGKAASIAVRRNCSPREVYTLYWSEMDQLLQLPGRARRLPDNTFDLSGPLPGPVEEASGGGIALASLKGIVVDNTKAKLTGKWTHGGGLPFVGADYGYARGPGNTATFEFTVPTTGTYEVRFASAPHENRASNTAITVRHAGGEAKVKANQRINPPIDGRWIPLGTYRFTAGQTHAVVVDAAGADGNAHIDAVQLLPAP